MDPTLVVIVLLIGALGGFFAGRGWAERRRARFDMRAVWNGRRRYRGQ